MGAAREELPGGRVAVWGTEWRGTRGSTRCPNGGRGGGGFAPKVYTMGQRSHGTRAVRTAEESPHCFGCDVAAFECAVSIRDSGLSCLPSRHACTARAPCSRLLSETQVGERLQDMPEEQDTRRPSLYGDCNTSCAPPGVRPIEMLCFRAFAAGRGLRDPTRSGVIRRRWVLLGRTPDAAGACGVPGQQRQYRAARGAGIPHGTQFPCRT